MFRLLVLAAILVGSRAISPYTTRSRAFVVPRGGAIDPKVENLLEFSTFDAMTITTKFTLVQTRG